MKHYFKKLPVFLYICLALLAYSCTYEKEFVNERNHEEVTVKRISFDDFSKNTLALAKLNQVKNKEIQLNRVIYDSINDFYINTDYGIYVQKGDKYSFTFAVYRDVYNGKTENLVLSSKDDGSFDSKMIEYDITAYEKELINSGEFVDLINKMEVFDFVSGKMFFDPGCYTIDIVETQNYCSGDGHSWDERYQCDIFLGNVSGTPPSVSTFTTVVDFSQCIQSGGGGENSGGTGVGASGGNGLLTTPVTCGQDCIIEDAATDDCSKIKKQHTKFPALKQNLIDLATTTTQAVENGIFIDDSATNTTINPSQNIPAGIGGKIIVNMTPSNDYVMIAHTHDAVGNGVGTYSVFSSDDLKVLGNLALTGKLDSSKFVFYLATEDGTRYAITIHDVNKLKDFFRNTLISYPLPILDNLKISKNEKIFEKFYEPNTGRIKANNTSAQNENELIAFLELMTQGDLGLTMFEVDPTYTIFTKLSLNFNAPTGSNIVKREPCN